MIPEATALAELEWLIHDPPLLQAPPDVEDGGALLRSLADQADTLRAAASELATLPRSRRLGWHFENLVATLLAHSERYQVVARNLPLREDGVTLGELDLLVRDRADDTLCHWELALKFYLGLPGEPPERAWPGPDPRDQLARKALHLYQTQLARARQPRVLALLAERGWTPRRRVLLTRGRLFYPDGPPPTLPDAVHPDHRRGRWRRAADATGPLRPVPHAFWHSPALSDSQTPSLADAGLRDYVDRQRSPVMMRGDGGEPLFLVPPHWPAPSEAAPASPRSSTSHDRRKT